MKKYKYRKLKTFQGKYNYGFLCTRSLTQLCTWMVLLNNGPFMAIGFPKLDIYLLSTSLCLSLSSLILHQETLRFLDSVVETVKEAYSTVVIKKAIRNQFKLMQL